ncbi:N,N-dimethylformamidase beta subunit family domain-containing protein [Nonomuraea sp. NPDC050536]|uniref:N,N-dimethylformamidase beta subunit family domain-containing protein n=1 Tax=Nonomuraea sp. NPDC050536 TaxID=3364366 RepID=UPI0037C5CFF7
MRKILAALVLLVTGCSPAAVAPAPSPARPVATVTAGPSFAAATDRHVPWRITRRGAQHEIEGYADKVSVLPGESFQLHVSTAAPTFTARAFRMGANVTQVWQSPQVKGVRQAKARTVHGTVTAAAWKPTLTVTTDGWPEGAYLIRLDASSGAQRYVPITVRSASTAGKVVLVNAVATWQAYNTWGGRDLYKGPGGFADRSRVVSFDRPYDTSGARMFLDFEKDAIEQAERSKVPLAYLTSYDLKPGTLDGAKAMVSLGHDEYWTPAMRETVTKARDHGVNLAFLGANAVYWKIALTGRTVACDKEVKCPLWRAAKPESALVGQMYDCFPADAAYVVRKPSHWIFQGTRGTRFPGMVGPETDKLSSASPGNVEVLAQSPLSCGGRPTVSDTTYYTAPSGAGVFASGTMRWVCAMRGRRCGHGVTDAAAAFTRRATTNLLTRFARGPVGSL